MVVGRFLRCQENLDFLDQNLALKPCRNRLRDIPLYFNHKLKKLFIQVRKRVLR